MPADPPAIMSPRGVTDRYHAEAIVIFPSNDHSGPARKSFRGTLEADKPNSYEAAQSLLSYVSDEFIDWVSGSIPPATSPHSECIVRYLVEFGRVSGDPVAEEEFVVKVTYSGLTDRALKFAFASAAKEAREWVRDLLHPQPSKARR